MSEAAEQAEDVKKLGDAVAKADDAMKKAAGSAGLYGAKLDKLTELVIGATGGEETVEKFKKAQEAYKLAGEAAATKGQRVTAMATAAKFAGAAVLGLGARVATFGAEARQASADLYLYDQRIRALGAANAEIQRSTAGAADATVAFNMQTELASRGIVANAQHQAVLARAIRETANARQISQEAASQFVTAALDGDAAAAARLNISLNGTTTTAQRYARVTQELATQQRGAAVATRNAAEEARVQEQASDRAWGSIKKFVFEASGLSLIEDTVHGVSTAFDGLRGMVERNTTAGRAAATQQTQRATQLREEARLANEVKALAAAKTADERRALNISNAVAAAELERYGVTVRGLGRAITAEEQYQLALSAGQRFARRAREEDIDFAQRRAQVAQELMTAVQRRNAEESRRDASRNATAELGVLAAQVRAHGGIVAAGIRSVSVQERYVALRREAANLAQREHEEDDAYTARATATIQALQAAQQAAAQRANDARETRTARDEFRDSMNERADLHAKEAEVTRRSGETELEYLRRRIEAQNELNQAAQQGHDEAQAAFVAFQQQTRESMQLEDQKRGEQQAAETERARTEFARVEENRRGKEQAAREAAESAALIERQNSMAERLRGAFGFAGDDIATFNQRLAEGAKTGADGLAELTKGVIEAGIAAAQSGEDGGAAVAKYVDQWAGAKAVQWGMQSLEALAGAGIAYLIRPDAVPGLLASAAVYGGLALGAGVTAAAIPNAPAASSGSGGVGRDKGFGMASSSRSDSAMEAKAQAPVIINISGVLANEQTQEVLVRAMGEAEARGLWGR